MTCEDKQVHLTEDYRQQKSTQSDGSPQELFHHTPKGQRTEPSQHFSSQALSQPRGMTGGDQHEGRILVDQWIVKCRVGGSVDEGKDLSLDDGGGHCGERQRQNVV